MPSLSKITDARNPSVEMDPKTMQDSCPPLDAKDVSLPEKPGRGRRALYWIKNFFTRGNVDENDPCQRYRDAELATKKGEAPPTAPDPAEKPGLGRRIWSMVKYIFTLGMVKDETYKKWHTYNKKVRKYNRALKKWVKKERRRQRAVMRVQKRIDAEKARAAGREKEKETAAKQAEPEREKQAEAQRAREAERDAPQQEEPQAQQEEPQAQQEEPQAQQEEPQAQQEEPQAQQEEPQAQQEEPQAQQEEPQAQQEEPQAQQAEPQVSESQQRAQARLAEVDGEISRKAGIADRANKLLCPESLRGMEPGERFRSGMLTLGLLADSNVQKACLGQDQDVSPEAAAANFKAVVDSILTNTPLDDKLLPMVENARKMAVETMDRSAGDRVDVTSWGIQAMNRYNRETRHTGGGVLTQGLLENLAAYGRQVDPQKDNLSTSLSKRDFKVAQGDVALEQLRSQSLDAQKTVLSAVAKGGQELEQLRGDREQMRSLTGTIMSVGTIEGMLEHYRQQGDKALDRAKVTVSQQAESVDVLKQVMSSTDQMKTLGGMPPERFTDLVIASEETLREHSGQVLAQSGAAATRQEAREALRREPQQERARAKDEDDLPRKPREEPLPLRRSNSLRGGQPGALS